jgi:hypothetical protein
MVKGSRPETRSQEAKAMLWRDCQYGSQCQPGLAECLEPPTLLIHPFPAVLDCFFCD